MFSNPFLPAIPWWNTLLSLFLVAYMVLDLWRLNRVGPAFALQEISVHPTATDDTLVFIRGRRSGVVGWVLTLLRLSADARLTITAVDLRIEHHSLSGFKRFYAPTHDLTSSTCGYYRAFSLLLLCISTLAIAYFRLLGAWTIADDYQRQAAMAAIGGEAVISALLAAAAYWFFEISKRITVGVETSGGVQTGIAFKRSIIENVAIGLSETQTAVDVLNERILRTTGALTATPANAARGRDGA